MEDEERERTGVARREKESCSVRRLLIFPEINRRFDEVPFTMASRPIFRLEMTSTRGSRPPTVIASLVKINERNFCDSREIRLIIRKPNNDVCYGYFCDTRISICKNIRNSLENLRCIHFPSSRSLSLSLSRAIFVVTICHVCVELKNICKA